MNEYNRKLEAISFNFKTKNGDSETNIDLFESIFVHFPNFIDLLPNDESIKRSVKIEKKKNGTDISSSFKKHSQQRLLTGKISSTNYGIIVKIIDPQDKDSEPVYQSKPEHGVEKVFFFLIHISENNNKGIILLERNGIYGIKTVFCPILKSFIRESFPENKIVFNDFIDKDILKRVVDKGATRSITIKTDKIPKELSDKLHFLEEEYKDYVISFMIKKKRGYFGSNTKKVLKKLFSSRDKSHVLTEELKVAGFGDNSEISSIINYDGRDKNINFNESFSFKSIYDISVSLDSFGESELDEISEKAINLFQEINPY